MDEAKLVLDMIMLAPPVTILLGKLIDRYGPPDAVIPTSTQVRLQFDEIGRCALLSRQNGNTQLAAPDTPVAAVVYWTAADHQQLQAPVVSGAVKGS